jgi:hypothetical protein
MHQNHQSTTKDTKVHEGLELRVSFVHLLCPLWLAVLIGQQKIRPQKLSTLAGWRNR